MPVPSPAELGIDGWMHLVEILGGGALGTKVLRVLIDSRDAIRDMRRDVGIPEPATGLFRRVSDAESNINVNTEDILRLNIHTKIGSSGNGGNGSMGRTYPHRHHQN